MCPELCKNDLLGIAIMALAVAPAKELRGVGVGNPRGQVLPISSSCWMKQRTEELHVPLCRVAVAAVSTPGGEISKRFCYHKCVIPVLLRNQARSVTT